MDNPKRIEITADKAMSYERIVNTILANLPEDYQFFDDVFELKDLCDDIDSALRNI